MRPRRTAVRMGLVVALVATGLVAPAGPSRAVAAPAPRVTIVAGYSASCALLPDGTAKCWGQREAIGDGVSSSVRPSPQLPVTVKDFTGGVAIASEDRTCAVMTDRTVKCWGFVPKAVPGFSNVVALSVGGGFECAIRAGGTIACRGGNNRGQLGHGDVKVHDKPVGVLGVTNAIAISAGGDHACALLADRTASCWGRNATGGLGTGKFFKYSLTPVPVKGVSGAIAVSAGGAHTCAILANRTVQCWGDNTYGQLGIGTREHSSTPTTVPSLASVVAISAGAYDTCAVLQNRSAKCWGANNRGQLGNGTYTTRSASPVAVRGITSAVAISVGTSHSCAVLADGSGKCWGWGGYGQLGDRKRNDSAVPVKVLGL